MRSLTIREDVAMNEAHEETEELKIRQADRETAERRMADEDPTEAGTAVHDRRAEKAAYLKEKLTERAESERDSEND